MERGFGRLGGWSGFFPAGIRNYLPDPPDPRSIYLDCPKK
jgi:hypothetical protein